MLYCSPPDVHHAKTKLPVALVSGGIGKLLAILLGMASHPKGAILIDELENGLYYKTMPDVWKALSAFSKRFSTQVFATTHSRECLQAALPALRSNEAAFRLLRVESRDGRHGVRLFSGDEFEAAVENENEVR